MLRQFFLWCTGRFETTLRENERKIAIGQAAANLLVLHLCRLPITSIDVSDPFGEHVYTLRDDSIDVQQVKLSKLVGLAAGRNLAHVADELLNGRRVANHRSSDRSLIGFCDGAGNILGADTVISHAKEVCAKIVSSPDATDFHVFLVDTVGRRVVAHIT
jgi:hypothetical protein